MNYKLIDESLLKPQAVAKVYPDKYNQLSPDDLNEFGQKICLAFSQPVAPLTIVAEDGMFQKALSAFAFPKPGGDSGYRVSWVAGVEFDLPSDVQVDLAEIDDKPIKVIVVKTADAGFVAFPFRKENPLKGGTKAGKLIELEVGSYPLTQVTARKTEYGLGVIVTVNGKEFWANKNLTRILHLRGLLPEVGSSQECEVYLRILSHKVTPSGNNYVTLGVSNNE